HSDTFFGEVSRSSTSKTALDMYDFLMETYSKSTKAKLLEFLAAAPDIVQLAALDQPALASVYCERLATHLFAKAGPTLGPVLQTKWRGSPPAPNKRMDEAER
ncbi:hypothetical protein D3872_21745, partial [Massilia cavernae]